MAHIYNSYGYILDLELRLEEASSFFEKAIFTNTKEGIHLCNMVEMCCKLKDPISAVKFAEKTKKLGHESPTLNAILESKGLRYS